MKIVVAVLLHVPDLAGDFAILAKSVARSAWLPEVSGMSSAFVLVYPQSVVSGTPYPLTDRDRDGLNRASYP